MESTKTSHTHIIKIPRPERHQKLISTSAKIVASFRGLLRMTALQLVTEQRQSRKVHAAAAWTEFTVFGESINTVCTLY